ncbi:flowering time control protein FPA [Castanea sativa]|uniref:flowering time control protein FPA n=1 Tax=Castanea sativa TaxID=21020 RepID=UPI003F64E8B5
MPPPNNKSMMMNTRPGRIGGDSDESETPSNNLWVGNLASDVADSDLMDLFAQYGALDSVTSYSSRSYAFVFFKRIEDAKAAKDTLQGADLHGHPIKIEFARPAKPSKHLWVGGISPVVSKEELEEEFLKFGKVEDFKFLRDRNTAFVEYLRLEDASQAMRNMNGKRIGGEQIRVDFLRSQPTRREQWPDSRDGDFQGRSMGPADSHLGHKRQLHLQSSVGRKGDGQPSNVLWVGYPPSVQIDEQMLHNAMILFGEIERIKSFPSRHYSFVEFRSVDEARRAKEGLQGRLFNDPRISIMFSSSELAPGKEYSNFYAGTKGPRPEFFNEHPFRPVQMDVFGHNHPMVPNNFPGPLPSIPMRPFGRQGSLEPLLPGPEFDDLTTHHNFQDGNLKNMMGPNWKRPSPAPGMLPSPAQGIRPPPRSTSGSWDVLDMNQFQRGSKRSRIDDALSIEDAPFPLRKIDDRGLGLDQSYGLGPVTDGGGGPFANVQGKSSLSPVGARVMAGGPGQGQVDNDYIWRGIIAKGGTPVCQARCIPLGKGIESELPEVVNCSARTGLDMLTKHYADAIGFDIVFFLPDSEDDFASYTEFLRYLGAKNRAGVAKFDDGTTLFLVPPSDFLTNVLKVAGPERLYGVVLKFPQQVSSGTSIPQQSHLPIPSSQYMDRQQIPPRTEYGVISSKEEQALPMDYDRVLHEDAKLPPKSQFPIASESPAMQPVPQDYASTNALSASQAGVTLTPELIATLASLLPANAQSSGLESAKPALGSSSVRPSIPPQVGPNKGTPSQDWKQDNQASDHMGHPLQQLGNQFNPHVQNLSQYQPYPSVSSTPTHSASLLHGNAQIHDSSISLPTQAAILSRPLNQSGQLAASPHVSQQYQHEIPPSSQRGYGMVNGMEASGLYSSQAFQPANSPLTSSNQAHGSLHSQPPSSEIPNQMQQLQSALFGAGQGTPEVEVDKNQRYQSTLQFAANLLLQIQQQQTTNQSGRGPGNQQ